MERFSASNFEHANDSVRHALCAELGDALSALVRKERSFHDTVARSIAGLRQLGHDLWSYDEDDEVSVWAPNYTQRIRRTGLFITFRADGPTEVVWSPETRDTAGGGRD